MTQYIFKIRDKATQLYLDYGYTFKKDGALEYGTERGARSAIDNLVHYKVGNQLYQSKWRGDSLSGVKMETINEWFPYDLEIVKVKVTYEETETAEVNNAVRNMLIANKLQDVSYSFSDFWNNATKQNYEHKIKFIFSVNQLRTQTRAETMKEARDKLRLLGIKGRTYREYSGMFGFYDKDQAFKARLTLDVNQFIDIEEIKRDLFEDGN
jgi:hypothetical protein